MRDNPLVDPSAEEFRQSLFELAQLYYRTGRYEEAVARLEELTQRYPHEDRMPQLVFLMADSYRKSAQLLDVRVASAAVGAGGVQGGKEGAELAEAAAARRERLSKARGLYDRAIELYAAAKPTSDLDKLYQKLAYFYRADCMYDLGNYQEAITLYDAAAFKYQNDPLGAVCICADRQRLFRPGQARRGQGRQQPRQVDASAHAARGVSGWRVSDAQAVLGPVAAVDQPVRNVVIYGRSSRAGCLAAAGRVLSAAGKTGPDSA